MGDNVVRTLMRWALPHDPRIQIRRSTDTHDATEYVRNGRTQGYQTKAHTVWLRSASRSSSGS